MKSNEPLHVITKINPKTRFRVLSFTCFHRMLMMYAIWFDVEIKRNPFFFFEKKNQTDRLNRYKQSKSFIQQTDGNQKELHSKRVHYIPFRIFSILGTGSFIICMIGVIAMHDNHSIHFAFFGRLKSMHFNSWSTSTIPSAFQTLFSR